MAADQKWPTPASAIENDTISISSRVMLMDMGSGLEMKEGAMIPVRQRKMNSGQRYFHYRSH
ncbi:hypothetical protein ACI2KS_25565 [Pseudomonas sp. NPDC087358]|uniref:hypothetical protein n=1 Tax=Pseudomonas sp. NPDC087358 TaxID=3364439 RepID=UPI00384E0583